MLLSFLICLFCFRRQAALSLPRHQAQLCAPGLKLPSHDPQAVIPYSLSLEDQDDAMLKREAAKASSLTARDWAARAQVCERLGLIDDAHIAYRVAHHLKATFGTKTALMRMHVGLRDYAMALGYADFVVQSHEKLFGAKGSTWVGADSAGKVGKKGTEVRVLAPNEV